jgi:beta-galactosidase
MLPDIGTTRPWADPEVVAIGRLPMHAPLPSTRRRSLNGQWHFKLFDSPDAIPARALTTDCARWRKLAVPGNWTVQDVGDYPHYTNVQMPFPGPPATLPERNPAGVYRRQFEVPRGWNGQQIVVHLGGAESVHAVWVNGAFVGYGTDSRLPSEYDITEAARPGKNEIAVVVVRYSALSYVEDQDQWWMAGLHREVYVEARPAVHLGDVQCHADIELTNGTGRLCASVTVGFVDQPSGGWRVRAELQTIAGKRIGRALRLHRPCGRLRLGRARCGDVVGRVAEPLSSRRRAGVGVGRCHRSHRTADRVPPRRGPQPSVAGQRPADLDLRRQPSRPPS